MNEEQKERAKKFFALLAKHGITEAIVVEPPTSADGVKANIEADGSLTMVDASDGERKEIIEKT